MCVRTWSLLLFVWGLCSLAWGEENQFREIPLNYAVDVRLAFYEAFRRPDASSEEPRPFLSDNSRNGYRSLGLRSASFNLHWEDFNSSLLSVSLRPDALQFKPEPGEEPRVPLVRDFDTRTGSVARKKPNLTLLQDYHLGVLWGEQLSLSYGLWDRLAAISETFSDINEFGLAVQLPRSVSGARVRLKRKFKDDVGTEHPYLAASGFIIQGRDNRSEGRTRHKRTFDVGPASDNPYWGGAIAVEWMPRMFECSLLGGYEERRDLGGRVKELLAGIVARKTFYVLSQNFSVMLDTRMSSEQWLSTPIEFPELLQLSSSLFLHWSQASGWKVLTGIHWGTSDRWFEERSNFFVRQTYRGYQFDLGFVKELQRHLFASLILSHERRFFDDGGDLKGAFDVGSDDDDIQRFGFELRYLL